MTKISAQQGVCAAVKLSFAESHVLPFTPSLVIHQSTFTSWADWHSHWHSTKCQPPAPPPQTLLITCCYKATALPDTAGSSKAHPPKGPHQGTSLMTEMRGWEEEEIKISDQKHRKLKRKRERLREKTNMKGDV